MINTKAVFIFNFLLITKISFSQSTIQWKQAHPGIWKLTVGKPENISLLKAAGIQLVPSSISPMLHKNCQRTKKQ